MGHLIETLLWLAMDEADEHGMGTAAESDVLNELELDLAERVQAPISSAADVRITGSAWLLARRSAMSCMFSEPVLP